MITTAVSAAATRTAYGDNLLAVGNQTSIQSHAGDLYADFDPLTEHPERVGNDLGRVEAAGLIAHCTVDTSQKMAGSQQPDALIRQLLPHLGRHLVLAGLKKPILYLTNCDTGTISIPALANSGNISIIASAVFSLTWAIPMAWPSRSAMWINSRSASFLAVRLV